MKAQTLLFTNDINDALVRLLENISPSSVFILVDTNTEKFVLPLLREECPIIEQSTVITIKEGDEAKNIDSLAFIWRMLVNNGANRHSVLINLGGGVVTDIGGFAASTFKRGIRFINIPTTLLSAVDAAVGGKTGINFDGLKNEIGSFCNADAVIISTKYFSTLPTSELLSGYAEMLKHSLIDGPHSYARTIGFDITECDLDKLLPLLKESVEVKKKIVDADPTERGLRKALNLGHTPAHAFESLAFSRGKHIPHGYAVAWGLVIDLIISCRRLGFPSEELHRITAFIRENYGSPEISCDDYDTIINYMHHDKKNVIPGKISFTLLKEPGAVELGATVESEEIEVALDIFRDLID